MARKTIIDARRALSSLRTELLPPDMVARIFATEDLDYVNSSTSEEIRSDVSRRAGTGCTFVGEISTSEYFKSSALSPGLGAPSRTTKFPHGSHAGSGVCYSSFCVSGSGNYTVDTRTLRRPQDRAGSHCGGGKGLRNIGEVPGFLRARKRDSARQAFRRESRYTLKATTCDSLYA